MDVKVILWGYKSIGGHLKLMLYGITHLRILEVKLINAWMISLSFRLLFKWLSCNNKSLRMHPNLLIINDRVKAKLMSNWNCSTIAKDRIFVVC